MVFDLVEATNNFLCRPQFRGSQSNHFYPSEASVVVTDQFGDRVVHGGCLRASYFRCKKMEGIPHTARSQSIFALGKTVEDMLVDQWKEMGIYIARSIRFQDEENNVSGELDVVLRDPETNKLFGVEVKSFYGYFATTEIFGNKSKAGQPKKNNLLQTIIYAWQFRDRLDHFKLLYEDRGDGSKKSFDVRVVPQELEDHSIVYRPQIDNHIITDFTVEDIYQRYHQLANCLKQETAPERDFELYYTNERIEKDYLNKKISDSKYNNFKKVSKRDQSIRYIEANRPGDWQCSYCQFKNLC